MKTILFLLLFLIPINIHSQTDDFCELALNMGNKVYQEENHEQAYTFYAAYIEGRCLSDFFDKYGFLIEVRYLICALTIKKYKEAINIISPFADMLIKNSKENNDKDYINSPIDIQVQLFGLFDMVGKVHAGDGNYGKAIYYTKFAIDRCKLFRKIHEETWKENSDGEFKKLVAGLHVNLSDYYKSQRNYIQSCNILKECGLECTENYRLCLQTKEYCKMNHQNLGIYLGTNCSINAGNVLAGDSWWDVIFKNEYKVIVDIEITSIETVKLKATIKNIRLEVDGNFQSYNMLVGNKAEEYKEQFRKHLGKIIFVSSDEIDCN